jgi:hypothetical protein
MEIAAKLNAEMQPKEAPETNSPTPNKENPDGPPTTKNNKKIEEEEEYYEEEEEEKPKDK